MLGVVKGQGHEKRPPPIPDLCIYYIQLGLRFQECQILCRSHLHHPRRISHYDAAMRWLYGCAQELHIPVATTYYRRVCFDGSGGYRFKMWCLCHAMCAKHSPASLWSE